MGMLSLSVNLLLVVSVAVVTNIAYKYCCKKRKISVQREIHEVLLFSYGSLELKKSKYSKCPVTHSMDRLLYYLNMPKHTLDICMYVMTSLDLAQAVLKQHFKGVKVRIIIDADMAFASGSHVRRLEKQGIPVRWMKSSSLMHHKFALIDATADSSNTVPVVMMGSLNWTGQAVNGNWEDVAVTSQKQLVGAYQHEFDRLWALFKPIVDIH